MLVRNRQSKVCLAGYVGTVILLSFSLTQTLFGVNPEPWCAVSVLSGPVLYYVLLNLILKLVLSRPDFEVVVRAAFLGLAFTFGAFLIWNGPSNIKSFGIYLALLSLFHWSEYMAIAVSNPKSLSTDSFVINHSKEYTIAALSSWIEFFVETHFFPEFKSFKLFWIVGAMICVAGEVLRKMAMVTASSNFTHLVQFEKQPEHRLVRHGIFSVMRHPSYVGWFWWSIATQIILANPICVVLYTLASWKFFKDRIYIEEITLINFFGHEYITYKKEVPTGLPYIDGYTMEEKEE